LSVAVAGFDGASGCLHPESTDHLTLSSPQSNIIHGTLLLTPLAIMFNSMQPSRPKVETYYQYPIHKTNLKQLTGPNSQSPMHQQQTRSMNANNQPRNQMEAMPPHQSPELHSSPNPAGTALNPAVVHPVFFSQAWRKAPYPLPDTTGFSPVATGYVFGGAAASRKEPSTKL
jgi:hypothetical protein